MMLKIVACAIATGLGLLVMVNVAHAQDAADQQIIKIDSTHVMVCGAKRPLDSAVPGAGGMVRVCEVRTVAAVRGGK